MTINNINKCFYRFSSSNLKKIPGSPIAYWVSQSLVNLFDGEKITDFTETNYGIITGDNNRFVRLWWEVSNLSTCTKTNYSARWVRYNKGGEFRRWYGNAQFVVDWDVGGQNFVNVPRNATLPDYQSIGEPAITWSDITSAGMSMRYLDDGIITDSVSPTSIPTGSIPLPDLLGYLNSNIVGLVSQIINPTLHFKLGDYGKLFCKPEFFRQVIHATSTRLIDQARADWNLYERAWDFQTHPLLTVSSEPAPTLESSYTTWIEQNRDAIDEMKHLEEENNRIFIEAYGLQDELTPDVPIEQVTLTVNPAYRYGGKLSETELWNRFRQDTVKELVSYAIGCMMGRYSLDAPGLIYAHSGNESFWEIYEQKVTDGKRVESGNPVTSEKWEVKSEKQNNLKTPHSPLPTLHLSFLPDDDGIIPLTDTEWFEDDACHRLVKFIATAWDKAQLEANLTFLANNLGPKKGESSRVTIRRYLCNGFFKDHLQTYKKRPIYWLFSSGKQKAFECLVYLHRYHEGTLSRMRTEYVTPLMGKYIGHIDHLNHQLQQADTAEATRIKKEIATLEKQQLELRAFDDKLRHYADQRISLDLDDGVKVNYGKFGDLLAEVKAVTGGK